MVKTEIQQDYIAKRESIILSDRLYVKVEAEERNQGKCWGFKSEVEAKKGIRKRAEILRLTRIVLPLTGTGRWGRCGLTEKKNGRFGFKHTESQMPNIHSDLEIQNCFL